MYFVDFACVCAIVIFYLLSVAPNMEAILPPAVSGKKRNLGGGDKVGKKIKLKKTSGNTWMKR